MESDEFEWDDSKAASNVSKHGVTFAEAATVFVDPYLATVSDQDHSDEEDRFVSVGQSARGRVLIVSFTDRGRRVRIISAREASRAERKGYEDGTFP